MNALRALGREARRWALDQPTAKPVVCLAVLSWLLEARS